MEEQFLYLTTKGWKTGKVHEIEIWFVRHVSNYYVVSEMREKSQWVQNIQHDQTVSFRVGANSFSGTARLVHSKEERELVSEVSKLMDKKYGWSKGLIVELKPA